MIKIGIIGNGVVGNAIYDFFNGKNINTKIFDKDKRKNIQNLSSLKDLSDCEIMFLCLPTPNDCDTTIINEVCQELSIINYKGICILKSTIPPNTTNFLCEKYNLQIIHNPEFLSQKTSKEDFKNQKNIILGISKKIKIENTTKIYTFYKTYFPNSEIHIVENIASECMKLFCNNFYAVKVQFFTELFLLCEKLRIDFNVVRDLMIGNEWINPMHTRVPGTDGKISYGGMCFPKDTKCLLKFMKEMETPCSILNACIIERDEIRKD
jgi:UDPglucose 6-dehydrogenase